MFPCSLYFSRDVWLYSTRFTAAELEFDMIKGNTRGVTCNVTAFVGSKLAPKLQYLCITAKKRTPLLVKAGHICYLLKETSALLT